MKRLLNKKLYKFSKNEDIQIGDYVIFKRHPYDKNAYQVKNILPDGTLFLDNNITSYTNIKPSTVTKL